MRRFVAWPVWALRLVRSLLEWSGTCPLMLLEVYVELAVREGMPGGEDLHGYWCPAAAGVA